MQNVLRIQYESELLKVLGMSDTEFNQQARFLLAAKLYELGRLSSGRAAELAGMERVEFLALIPTVGVPTSNLTQEDLTDDLKFAGKAE
jgi:predicted HTH domain antitoxin